MSFSGERVLSNDRPISLLTIVTDQQRRDLMGCYGREAVRTPATDRLATEGVVFDQAFTVTPICAPAASLASAARNAGTCSPLK